MTTTALNSAMSGLRIAQKALDVTAANISNADTEGYTKKTLPQQSLIMDGVGIGVRYSEVQRYVDQAIQRDYRTQLGVQGYQASRESYLSRILALSGSTDAENNLGSALGSLYNSFAGLSALPNSVAKQQSVVAAAHNMTKMLNGFSDQLAQLRNDAQQDLKVEVAALNATLENIAQLNKNISSMQALGRSTAELEDQRDIQVKKVAAQLDVTYYTEGTGVLVLQTKQGHVLVDRDARPVEFNDTHLNVKTLYPDSHVSGVILHVTDKVSFDMAAEPVGGRIGALLNMRDQDIPSYNAQLDELAHKLMLRFDEQGLRLFTDGDGNMPANSASAYTGIAGTIRVNQAVITNPTLVQQGTNGVAIDVNSNAIINKIMDFTFGATRDASGTPHEEFRLSGTGYHQNIAFNITGNPNATLAQFASAFLDGQAADYNTTKEALTVEVRYGHELEQRLLDSSAVNTDEEMARMIQFQRTYSASAKMISALDELFRDLLNAI